MLYHRAFLKFESYIKNIYKNPDENREYKGYLINLEDFEYLKEKINNELNIKHSVIKQIEFPSSKYLMNMLMNGSKYIIINDELYNVIYSKQKNEISPLTYIIARNSICIYFNKEEKLYFKHHNNILDISHYINDKTIYKKNFDEIKKIYDDINVYHKLEKEFTNNLKKKYNLISNYYLISKEWIDEWKKITNYEEIKNFYLESKYNTLNNKNKILKNIISHIEKNNYRYNEIMPMKVIDILNFSNICSKNSLELYFKKNSFAIINFDFTKSFNVSKNNILGNRLEFKLIDNELYINCKLKKILIKHFQNNILLSNKEYNLNFSNQLIRYYYFQENLYKLINLSYTTVQRVDIYCINKKGFDKYKSVFEYDKLIKDLNQNEFDYNNFYTKTIKLNNYYLDKLEDKDISKELKFENEYTNLIIKEYNKSNLYYSDSPLKYISDFDIIDEKIYLFLVNNNILQEAQAMKGYYIIKEGKIYLKLDLNPKCYQVGSYDSENNFINEYLIEFEYENKMIDFFSKISFDYFNLKYSKNPENKKLIINSETIGYFYKLNNENMTINLNKNINQYQVSNKLKMIILLLINKKFNINIKNNEFTKVFLINKKWYTNFKKEFDELKELIENNDEIVGTLKKCNKYSPLNTKFINDIISNIDIKSLKKIDEKIKSNNIDELKHVNIEKIKLINDSINIYNEFIIVNESIFKYIQNLDNLIEEQIICYFNNINEDAILKISNNKLSKVDLIGKFNNENNSFDIKFIFNSEQNLDRVYNKLLNEGIDRYIDNNMIFNKNNENDLISPILENNDLIGYCYKYKTNFDYNSCFDCYNLLINYNIKNSISIYYNYERLREKLQSKNNKKSRNFYIINKDWINTIKNKINFQIINDLLKNNNIKRKDEKFYQKFLSLMKSLPEEELIKFEDKKTIINKFDFQYIEPNIIPFHYFQANEPIFIIDNFEIFYGGVFEECINKDIKNNITSKCFLCEGKIIINNPNFVKNIYYSLICSFKENNSFLVEYILIYKKEKYREDHLNKISKDLLNYLKNLQLYENTEPIIDQSFTELGTIIKVIQSRMKRTQTFNNKKKYNTKNFNNFRNNNNYDKNNFFTEANDNNNNYNNDNDINIKEENNRLKMELMNEKEKNRKLENELNKIKTELNNLQLYMIQNKSLKINSIDDYKTLSTQISEKDSKIKELKDKLNRYPFDLKEGEKLMTIQFYYAKYNFYYTMFCKNTDIFNNIEKKIYENKIDYYNPDNLYMTNGIIIDKYKSLKDNNINNNDQILIYSSYK